MDIIAHALTGALVGHAVSSGTPAVDTALLTIVGVVGGCLPDLDALTRHISNEAGWRYHRVALHGLLPAGVTLFIGILGMANSLSRTSAFSALLTLGISMLMHLVLDATTSFGTALLFPFSRWRASLRTHFIIDPLLVIPAAIALIIGRPLLGFVWIALHIIFSFSTRRFLTSYIKRRLISSGLRFSRISLEPKPFAPFCWLVVIDAIDRYILADLFPWKTMKFFETDKGDKTIAKEAAQHSPLLRAFLATCDFARFEDVMIEGSPGIIVEDIKWWLWLPFRPHAFSAKLDETGQPYNVRQSSYFERGPAGLPESPPVIQTSISSSGATQPNISA